MFFNVLYYTCKLFTCMQSLYMRYVVGSFEKVYDGHIIRVRRFDIANNTIDNIYSISIFQHVGNFTMAVYMALMHPTRKWYSGHTVFDPEEVNNKDTTYGFYEFTFWNGKQKLIRASGTTVPNPCPPPLFKAGLDKKVLHVSLCGHDVTDFVNRYVTSLTKENKISANDLFELAILDHILPKHLHYHREESHNISTEFIMCDEIIEKTEFKGMDVVFFNG